MANSREKGASGEREFCQLLGKQLGLPWLRRNLSQYQTSNLYDILTSPPDGTAPDSAQACVMRSLSRYAIEVKRYKSATPATIHNWLKQACKQAKTCEPQRTALLAYRLDRDRWKIMIPVSHTLPPDNPDSCVTVSMKLFTEWLQPFNTSPLTTHDA